MRTVHFITLVTEREANKAHTFYRVVDTNEVGATRQVVRISIDLNPEALGTLAKAAVDSATGKATLYYRAITATVQK
jgi:hypothetical protein